MSRCIEWALCQEQWLKTQSWITYGEDLPIVRRFWRVIFGRRLEVNPQYVMPDLRSIREAVSLGLGYSVLPDYLCQDWVVDRRLTLVLKPIKAVNNSIWLTYRKSEGRSQQVTYFKELIDYSVTTICPSGATDAL